MAGEDPEGSAPRPRRSPFALGPAFAARPAPAPPLEPREPAPPPVIQPPRPMPRGIGSPFGPPGRPLPGRPAVAAAVPAAVPLPTRPPVAAPVARPAAPPPPGTVPPRPMPGFGAPGRFGMPGAPLSRAVPVAPPRPPAPPVARPSSAAVGASSSPLPAAPAPRPATGGIGAIRATAQTLPEAPLDDDDDAPGDGGFERINATQVRYRPMSRINPTDAVVPLTMAMATRAALERLDERVGGIDAWLCARLRWTPREMGSYLTAEQIDGVALALDAADRKQGLIVADMTGFGKGRVLAATARAVALSGRDVVFLTEKANLFSDFWRDIRDIGSEDVFGRPFMLNDGARIVDTSSVDGRVIVPAWKKAEVDRVLKAGALPKGSRLAMATYTQFNRAGTRKSDFLAKVAAGNHLVLDEAHNFVGDSATGKTVGAGIQAAGGSTFSSATFARDVTNLAAYSSVFPWLSRIEGLEDMTPAQRRALAEESVRLASEAGSIIRREHDLTNMNLRMVTAEGDRRARNEILADRLAPVLSLMGKLARRVDAILEERNEANRQHLDTLVSAEERRSEREAWLTANFGSRLSAILQQFLVALNVDPCVELCVETLLSGGKPVVVIESTMESLMREMARDDEAEIEAAAPEGNPDQGSLDLAPAPAAVADDAAEDAAPAGTAGRPPTFRDALVLLADRLLRVGVRRGVAYEKQHVPIRDPAEVAGDLEALSRVERTLPPEEARRRREALELQASMANASLVSMQAEILAMVDDFPELSLSPIDDIRDRIEAEGRRLHAQGALPAPWSADEISARSMRVVDDRYVSMPAADRNQIVARFVNGSTHMLVLTQAASTGLSIHDSEKFLDHARRHMIELSPPRNVLARIQMWGRVWRRGQLTEPEFSVVDTGLPFHSYDLAARNRKLSELSASVTGTSKATVALDVPDALDPVGNEVAHDLLQEQQQLAEAMGISLNVDKEEADKELYFVGKLFRRLPLLPAAQQARVYRTFFAAYEDRVRNGADVHSGRDLEGQWQPVRREILEAGDGSADPVTGRDVTVTTLRSERDATPMTTADVVAAVREARARLGGPAPFGTHLDRLRDMRPDLLEAALPRKRFRTVRQALQDGNDNAVKRTDLRLSNMSAILGEILPGKAVRLPIGDEEMGDALVLDVRVPPPERASVAREYEIVYALPGDERPRSISLDAMVRERRTAVAGVEQGRAIAAAFDAAPRGRVSVERKILDGNGIGAVLAASRLGCGTRVTWRDRGGAIRTGILLPRSVERRIAAASGRTNLPSVAAAVLAAGGRLRTDATRPGEGVEIRPAVRGGGVSVVLPGAKRAAKPFETEAMLAVTGPFSGDWREREARVPADKVPEVLAVLAAQGREFHFDAAHRRLAVERTRAHAAALAPAREVAAPRH